LLLLLAAAAGYATEQKKNEDPQLRTLTGHVFDGQDQPLPKAIVYLKNTKTLAIKTYITDTDGTYRFPALSLAVDYEVYAEHQGARSDTKTVSSFDNRKQVEITLRIKSK
jgi:hypothetical protein